MPDFDPTNPQPVPVAPIPAGYPTPAGYTLNTPYTAPPAQPPAPTPTPVAADPVTVAPSPAPAVAPAPAPAPTPVPDTIDVVVAKPAEAAWYVKAFVFFGVLAAVFGVHYAYQHGMIGLPAIPSLSAPAPATP